MAATAAAAIYTRSVARSPVVRWILHARVRHRRLNDVVFVGEGFVEVRQVGPEGHLVPVALKTDFDARIRAATRFQLGGDDGPDEDFLVKLERDAAPLDRDAVPPQSVLLTLDSNDMVFVFLRPHDDRGGGFRFVQQICPLPAFDRILFQPGEHLAVDPFSRAIAVAANVKEVILYAVKPTDHIHHEIQRRSREWCPVSAQKPVQVEGVIQHMDFLIPPSDDADHIILLLIVVRQHRTTAVRIEWHHSTGPRHAHVYPGQPLACARTVSSLLIPLQEAAFLLVTGNEMTLWRNILSGSATEYGVPGPDVSPRYPGVSAHAPVWASWAKPRRSQAARSRTDFIYLAREDGLVLLMTIPKASPTTLERSVAGDLGCHVGTAFASLGDEGDPDILCVAGSASSGKVVSIGNWPSVRRIEEMSRLDTMNMEPIQILPNWSSVTDMIPTNLLHPSRARNAETDSLFVTSGKQPFGTISEIRTGIEARLCAYVELEGLRTVTDAWVLPDLSLGTLIIVLSNPDGTRLLTAGAEFNTLEDFEQGSAFDMQLRTIAAGVTASGHLVQITRRALCASTALQANFEDTSRHHMAEGSNILASVVIQSASIVVTAEQHEDEEYTIACYRISSTDSDSAFRTGPRLTLPREPLCIAALHRQDCTLALTATHDGTVALVCFNEGSQPRYYAKALPVSSADPAACDSVVLLGVDDQLLAVCGLRDGRVVSMGIDLDSDQPLGQETTTDLGYSGVKLVQLPSDGRSAIAMTGASVYLLSWPGGTSCSLTCESIWITDKARPEMTQGAIAACAQIPSASLLFSGIFAEHVVLISEGDMYITSLESTPSTVPRQIPVTSTPNRLVYAAALKQLVCCGVVTEARTLPSPPGMPPEEKRQIWPRLEFIPATATEPTFRHDLQPGERVNALLPWSVRTEADKTYSHILVGGSYVRTNGKRRGKVTFLQPIIKRSHVWEVSEMRETRRTVFDDEVYSLALYDDMTYVACAGDRVHVQRLSMEESKWDQVCTPLKVASPGMHVSVEGGRDDMKIIMISTSADSLVTLRLLDQTDERGSTKTFLVPVSMGPRADVLLSHIVPSHENTSPALFALASTKYGRLLGMSLPVVDPEDKRVAQDEYQPASILCEAQLPRSLTRMVRSAPAIRNGPTPAGVVSDRITGSAADGAVLRLALLGAEMWQKLSWLQRLVERSEMLSPHSYQNPKSTCAEKAWSGEHRAAAAAAAAGFGGEVSLATRTSNSRSHDSHVDGDILARALVPDAAGRIKQVLVELSAEDDAGRWGRAHVDTEMEEKVEEAIELVRKMDAWIR